MDKQKEFEGVTKKFRPLEPIINQQPNVKKIKIDNELKVNALTVDDYEKRIQEIKIKYEQQIKKMKFGHEQEVKKIRFEHQNEIMKMKSEFEKEIEQTKDDLDPQYYEFDGHQLKTTDDLNKYIRDVYFTEYNRSRERLMPKSKEFICFVPQCKSKFKNKFQSLKRHLAVTHFNDKKIIRCLGTYFINLRLNAQNRNSFTKRKLSAQDYKPQQFVKQTGDDFEFIGLEVVCDECGRKSAYGTYFSHHIRCASNANCYWLSYLDKDGQRQHSYGGSSFTCLRFLLKPVIARLIEIFFKSEYAGEKWVGEINKLINDGKLYATKLIDLCGSNKAKGCEYKLNKKFSTFDDSKNVNRKLDGRNFEKYMDDQEFESLFLSNSSIVHYQITTSFLDNLIDLLKFLTPNFIQEIKNKNNHKSTKLYSSFDTFEKYMGGHVDCLDFKLYKINLFNKPVSDLIKYISEFDSTKLSAIDDSNQEDE